MTEVEQEFSIKVVIPFRDRGIDPRRAANLTAVMTWWWAHGISPVIVSDGGSGDDQFNRHRAYNDAVTAFPETDVFIFTEADMLIPVQQILSAARMAQQFQGLVVPFLQYRYLSDERAGYVRHMIGAADNQDAADFMTSGEIFEMEPESTMDGGRSIGAVNVVSRETLNATGGFTEQTRGNWYDDRIIEEGFAYLTGVPTRYVEGSAVHLYHLPGWTGDHLSEADKAATAHNKELLQFVRSCIHIKASAEVRAVLSYREARV